MHLVEMIARDKQETGLQVFSFGDNPVRVVRGEDGEPWFVAKDVAEVLGYTNPRKAVGDHCKSAISGGVTIRDAIGRNQDMTIIPERDVYRLIMRSNLPTAERFEEWVVGEVLPSIRKTGHFSIDQIGRKELAQMVWEAETEKELLAARVSELEPKAEGYDQIMSAENAQSMGAVAKTLGTGRQKLFAFLRNHNVLLPNNTPYQKYMDRGYFRVIEKPIVMGDKNFNYCQTLVTPKGLDYIRKLTMGSLVREAVSEAPRH